MSAVAYAEVISAAPAEKLDLFLTTANRLGTPIGNVEKDFWVCWTLDALYRERPAGGPRLLFKGGTSLSKAYGLIERFSEDIDVTVFRDDLDEPASVEELEALSNNKRRARLDAIRDACRSYITGALHDFLAEHLAAATDGKGRVEIDEADPDRRFWSGIQRLSRATSPTCDRQCGSSPAPSRHSTPTSPGTSGLTLPTMRADSISRFRMSQQLLGSARFGTRS